MVMAYEMHLMLFVTLCDYVKAQNKKKQQQQPTVCVAIGKLEQQTDTIT